MKSIFNVFVIYIVGMLSSSFAFSQEKSDDFYSDLLTGLKYSDMLVSNATVTFNYEHIYPYLFNSSINKAIKDNVINDELFINSLPVSNLHEKSFIEYSYDNERIHLKKWKFNEITSYPIMEILYDGEKVEYKGYEIDSKGLMVPKGAIREKKTIQNSYYQKYDPRFFGLSFLGEKYSELFERYIKEKKVLYGGKDTIENEPCNVFIIKDKNIDIMTWIGYNYKPNKIIRKTINPSTETVIKISYVKQNNGIFLPKKVVTDQYFSGKYVNHQIYTFNNWSYNVYLKDKFLTIFPKGMKVFDERLSKDIQIE